MSNMNCWIRNVKVVLRTKDGRHSMTFDNSYTIDVSGSKYMAAMQDSCTVRIKNMAYTDMLKVISQEYFDVIIFAGYGSNPPVIFKGGIVYISNTKDDYTTNECIILCASYLVARFSQQRLKLSMNSGINLYAAIKYIFKKIGINTVNLDTEDTVKLTDMLNIDTTIGSYLQSCADQYHMILNTDTAATNAVVSIQSRLHDNKLVEINNRDVLVSDGYPRLTTDGFELTLLPTSITPGNIVHIDNSILDLSEDQQVTAKTIQLNPLGHYLVYQIDYRLETRGSNFTMRLRCRNNAVMENWQ